MSARDTILGKVRSALEPLKERAPLPDWDADLVRMRAMQPAADLVERFSERMKAVNGIPLTSVAQLLALLCEKGWKRGYCDPAVWSKLRVSFGDDFTVETRFDRSRVDDYDFGITVAEAGIAETGTVVLSDQGTSSRLAALAPWLHVAVLDPKKIHPDIASALAVLPKDPNVIWVTGPSKTADIEGILIEGVHGPGIQVALLIDPQ